MSFNIKQALIRFSTIGSAIFILMLLLSPRGRFNYNTRINLLRHPSPRKSDEPFSKIQNRIERDKINIQKICTEYLSSHPKPKKPNINIQIQNMYHVNNEKKLGWCFNAKVRMTHICIKL